MDFSILISRAMGIYMVLMGLAVAVNVSFLRDALAEVTKNPAMQLLDAAMRLLMGSIIVVAHPHWTSDWRVCVTILGWVILVSGTYRAWFPQAFARTLDNVRERMPVQLMGAIAVILGLSFIILSFSN